MDALEPSLLPGAHPVLSCAEALDWERTILGGDPAREWSAMSRAGRAVAAALLDDLCETGVQPDDACWLVLCGKGHNGGDALIALHALLDAHPRATAIVLVVPGFAGLRPLARRAFEALHQAHAPRVMWEQVGGDASGRDAARVRTLLHGQRFTACLDGLFGMQFKPPLRAPADWLLPLINDHPAIGMRAAVDLPSGVGDAAADRPFRADFTYATGIAKRAVLTHETAGRVRYLDLGFFLRLPSYSSPEYILTSRVLDPLRTLRDAHADKRTFGHLFVVSGSRSMPGAVMMAVESALRSGAGLVTAFVPETVADIGATRAPEAMWVPMPETPGGGLALEGRGTVVARAARCTALLIGPGLGRERESLALVHELLRAIDVPTVLDADALQPDLVAVRPSEGSAPRVLTPHAGELERIRDDARSTIAMLARRCRATIVQKGSPTRVCDAGGSGYVSLFGGPVLARGGSGDVLAGLIGGQLAQGAGALQAAARGVVWQGLAADRLARRRGVAAVRTLDLCEQLGPALQEISDV